MKDYQREFIEFAISQKVLIFGSFELKSKRKSPYFFNAGEFNSGSTLVKLGRFYANALIDSGLDWDVLFGPAYKGIPLVCALAMSLPDHNKFAFNRKEVKDHGEGGSFVGSPLIGKVVVIDDVITAVSLLNLHKGTAIRESASMIQKQNAELAGVLIAIDREEMGANTNLSAVQQVSNDLKVPVVSIVSISHVIEYLREQGQIYQKEVMDMENYRKEWGI